MTPALAASSDAFERYAALRRCAWGDPSPENEVAATQAYRDFERMFLEAVREAPRSNVVPLRRPH